MAAASHVRGTAECWDAGWVEMARQKRADAVKEGAMLQLTQAIEIKNKVRGLYKPGYKSSNKVYADRGKNPSEYLSDDEFNEIHKKEMLRVAISQQDQVMQDKFKKRNTNAPLSLANRGPLVAPRPYDQGKLDLKACAVASPAGNCDEMAVISVVLAIDEFNMDRACVFIGSIGAPGDHVFCVVCEKPSPPAATKVEALAAGGIIIDPWLNTACETEKYMAATAIKLGEWEGKGKRISWGGKDGKNPGWYAPGGDYAATFKTAPLSFKPA
jgi:hypothetical protein